MNTYFRQGAITSVEVEKMVDALRVHGNIGAQLIFQGQVRDDVHENSPVTHINYSAYEPMANEVFAKIESEIMRNYPVIELRMAHSLGTVHVGEHSLCIVMGTKHRAGLFEAMNVLVQRIKAEVPIFGKEITANGSVWKINCETCNSSKHHHV